MPFYELFTEDVKVEMVIYTHQKARSRRKPDSDCMQNKIYANDRQVKLKMIYWQLDKENPRTIIAEACDINNIINIYRNINNIIELIYSLSKRDNI